MQSLKISVSNLHLCYRCPRLLAFQLSGKKNAWKVGKKGTFFCGEVFHDYIAARFHRDAAGQKEKKQREILDLFQNNANDPKLLKNELLALLDRNYFSPLLNEKSKTFNGTQIESLVQCIDKWSDFLIGYFCNNSGFRADPAIFLEHVFLPPEQILRAKYEPKTSDGTILTVSGKYDCALLDHTQGKVLLIDFKCFKETDATEELAQLSLYAWLVREYSGFSSQTCVLYLEEENPAVCYPVDITDGVIESLPQLFDKAIQVMRVLESKKGTIPKTSDPHLCGECFYRGDCDSRFGKGEK
jgi:CRISPR/Cas system-associated exonuclease Cas4 (RecB family)